MTLGRSSVMGAPESVLTALTAKELEELFGVSQNVAQFQVNFEELKSEASGSSQTDVIQLPPQLLLHGYRNKCSCNDSFPNAVRWIYLSTMIGISCIKALQKKATEATRRDVVP